jgi:putative lipoic acid-binding regulatory protein
MSNLPSVELLESTHEFPGPFTFKAIGQAEGGFVVRVVAAVRQELEIEIDPPYSTKQTRGGRHVSVTLEPEVESAWQVLAIYGRIQETAGLVMLF